MKSWVTNTRSVKSKGLIFIKKILAEATSTLVQEFFIVLFLTLYYTFIKYDERKSNEQRAKRNEQRAESKEQRAKSSGLRDFRWKGTKISTLIFEAKYYMVGPKIIVMALCSILLPTIIHYSLPLNNHVSEPVIFHTSCVPGMVNKMWIPSPLYPPLETVLIYTSWYLWTNKTTVQKLHSK